MQVSFTGLKNVGYMNSYGYPVYNNDNNQHYYNKNNYFDLNIINMELTDDFNGKDLSEYKKAIKNANIENAHHPLFPNFINFGIVKNELDDDKDTYFFLNGAKLPVTDENMNLFSFLAKSLDKLNAKSVAKFTVNEDYLSDPDTARAIMLGEDMSDKFESEEETQDYLKYVIHDAENVKNGSSKMIKLLEDKIYDYLGI